MKTARSSIDNIRVFSRFRPLNEGEQSYPLCVDFEGEDCVICRQVQSPGVPCAEDSLQSTSRAYNYSFSRVYLPDTAQKSIYDDVAHPIVNDVMNGYNGSVFVYGQTGSGKTHSMFGAYTPQSSPRRAPSFSFYNEDAGITPRAVQDIFHYIHNADESVEFEIRVLFIEVYMEHVRDLLNPTGINLHVREDTTLNNFYVEGCEMPYVTSPEEIMELVSLGLSRRATAATASNDASSRSHCVLNITVKAVHHAKSEATIGKLYLVDLAGSERASTTQAAGTQLEEAKLINRSLTTLGHVIGSLAEKQAFVPYRDSKLTCILKDSLGGNSRTALLVCCSPSILNEHKTVSSLRFGVRAQNVCNRAVVNRQCTVEKLKSLLGLAQLEIQALRSQLVSVSSPRADAVSLLQHSDAIVGAEVHTSITSLHLQTMDDSSARRRHDSEEQMHCDSSQSLLRSGKEDPLDMTTPHEEVETLRGALHDAQESERLLSKKYTSQSSMLQFLREECTVWEEEHAKLSRELFAHQRYGEHCCTLLRESRDEASLLAHRVLSYVEQLRMSRTRVKEPRASSEQQKSLSTGDSLCHKTQSKINPTGNAPNSDENNRMEPNDNVESSVHALSEGKRAELNNVSLIAEQKHLCLIRASETVFAQMEGACNTAKNNESLDGVSVCVEKGNNAKQNVWDTEQAVLVERMNAAMNELEVLRNSAGALTLELQLAEKRISIRQERIESLKCDVRRERATKQKFQQMLDEERAAHQAQLYEANSNVLYWRHRCEELLRRCHVKQRPSTEYGMEMNDSASVLEGVLASAKRGNSSGGGRGIARGMCAPSPSEE